MTFFLEITLKPDKNDEEISGIFTLSLEHSHYFRIFAEGENLEGTLMVTRLQKPAAPCMRETSAGLQK